MKSENIPGETALYCTSVKPPSTQKSVYSIQTTTKDEYTCLYIIIGKRFIFDSK
jgi:hypothetical protein